MCANSTLELSISNASDFSQFTWNLGTDSVTTTDIGNLLITGIEGFAGTYAVEAQFAECALQLLTSNSVNISTYPLSLPEISQNGNTISAQSFSSYQWLLAGVEIPGAISQFYNPLEDGSYTVNVIDEFGCEFSSEAYLFSEVGIHEHFSEVLKLYPNPATEILTVTGVRDISELEIINSTGQIVLKVPHFHQTNGKANVSELASGLYFVKAGTYVTPLIIE